MSKKVSIRYLIDVAIGNPEPGIVNFNALYTVLLAISEKLDIEDEQIEIDSSFFQVHENAFDSKSNVSSERLMEHQVYDKPPEYDKEGQRIFGSRSREIFQNKSSTGSRRTQPPRTVSRKDDQTAEDRKVVFGQADGKIEDEEIISSHHGGRRSKTIDIRQHIDSLNDRLGKIENFAVWSVDTEQSVECLRQIVQQLQDKIDSLERSVSELKENRHAREEDISACRTKLDYDKLSVVTDGLRKELDDLRDLISRNDSRTLQTKSRLTESPRESGEIKRLEIQLIEMKTNLCNFNEKITSFEEAVAERCSPSATLDQIQNEILSLKAQMENSGTATIQTEHQTLKDALGELTKKFEEVIKSKIDKDEVDELLSEKADFSMLHQKVSVEHMDAENRKLETQLAEISDCVMVNEEQIQKQIDDIKKLVGDESFKDMLHDFKTKIDKEIKMVSDGLKRLSEIKPTIDSAMTRLKNLTCLACDQDVVMRTMELNNVSKLSNAHASKSISPSITYEVGKLREIGKFGLLSEDKILFENKFRHTGGDHTIITNKDRVSRARLHRSK